MKKSVKLKDIAEHAAVSVASVSAALNGTGRIGDELRARILEVARQMNYEPNLAAKFLKQKHCSDIGLVISDVPQRIAGSGFFQPLVYNFIQLCDDQGIRCQIEYHDPEIKDGQVPSLLTGGFTGGVLYGGAIGTATRRWLKENPSFPIVTFEDRECEYTIHSRYDLGTYTMVQHLAALGHRRIALLAGLPRYELQQGMREGFARAVADFQLDTSCWDREYAFLLEKDSDTMREGVEYCEKLFARSVRPTALVIADARLAKAALYTALKHGIDVPRDLSIFTSGSNYETEQIYPALSSICWNAHEAIYKAYHLLRNLMEGRIPVEKVIEIEPLLTLRNSTARCHDNKAKEASQQ